jgi:valyl-tRNA synthetase
MLGMIETTFNPKAVEPIWSEAWEKSGAFKPSNAPGADPFCVVIPPPNVTGSLHIGHALNNTLQDILVRFERLRGKSVLWQPGTDHAGIATQMVVERQLAAEGNIGRREMGREDFLKRVWAWKEESGGTIFKQLRRLGASCDWSRERFTMDEGLSAAVLKVFVALHKDGLIYKDKRLVNWDPHFETAISDLEVVNKETKGHMWRIAYPLEDGSGEIVVATTRPETMLGDVAVAVNPKDERYQSMIGKQVKLPLTGRLIPIIADDYADPEAGTGAVKITPAHDFNDFKVGKRHNLPMINILTSRGLLNDDVPLPYRGLDRSVAREKVLQDLEAEGLRRGEDNITHTVPHGDRSGVVVEPWLTDQWYVDAPKLAVAAIAAVEGGKTKFTPKNWEKTYFEWMRNIEPWCVSRQLWWGHRIPAWYGPEGSIFVEESETAALAAARAKFGRTVELTRDEDVLDTWFSSALWPFSTLGWPQQTPELKTYYPTSILVTAHDIIFFWVARMMMMGLHFTGKAPFKRVFINALVRDDKGQKMSKSKGNTMDPLELIDRFGADALRFTLAAMAAQGRDIKLAKSRVEGYRNFSTKLWNATKFAQMNGCELKAGFDPGSVKHTLNKWVVSEAVRTTKAVEQGIKDYKFNEAAGAIYGYVWNVFCDWYIELTKPLFSGADEAVKAETRATAAWALDHIVHLLHPFMPYVTEELFQEFGKAIGRKDLLISRNWPSLDEKLVDAAADAEVNWVIRLITSIRSTRSDLRVPAGAKAPLTLVGASAETEKRLATYQSLIERLARLETASVAKEAPKGAIRIVIDEATACLDIASLIDLKAEIARLEKEIARLTGEIAGIDKKLANEQFVAKAPPEVIEEQHERREAAEAALLKLGDALKQLKAAG